MPSGSCVWLVQKTGPFDTVGQDTLEQARAAHMSCSSSQRERCVGMMQGLKGLLPYSIRTV